MAVRAIKNEAIDFIEKPFRGQVLMDRIFQAIEQDRIAREARARRTELAARFDCLTPREHEVFRLLAQGCSLKQVAHIFQRSTKTVDAHNWHLMKKLDVHDRVELLRLGLQAGLVQV